MTDGKANYWKYVGIIENNSIDKVPCTSSYGSRLIFEDIQDTYFNNISIVNAFQYYCTKNLE
eukprot:11036490-Ditylum_brightwellii.AAC.1